MQMENIIPRSRSLCTTGRLITLCVASYAICTFLRNREQPLKTNESLHRAESKKEQESEIVRAAHACEQRPAQEKKEELEQDLVEMEQEETGIAGIVGILHMLYLI